MKQDTQIRNSKIIAIVDDDDSVRTALESLLRSSGYKVQTYCSALAFLNTNGPAQAHLPHFRYPDAGNERFRAS